VVLRATCIVLALAAGCGDDVTEVVLVVEADPGVAERTRFLAVRIYDTEGATVLDRAEEVSGFPQQIPLTPRGGDASRRWRVEVDARNALDCTLSSETVMGGYEDGVSLERTLRLTSVAPDPCPMGPGCSDGCDDGMDCTDDGCVEGWCLNDVAAGRCAIDRACLSASDRSADDPCLTCVPETSQSAWTLAAGCDAARVARFDEGASAAARYGEAVAIDERHAVIGAPEANDGAGQAFALRLDASGAWVFDGELVPRERAAGDSFGRSVDVFGEWIVVGAPDADTGRALLFRRDPTAGWVPDQELTSASLEAADLFGASVAIDGDIALVGATHREAPLGEAGSVFVFRRGTDDRWTELALVEPPEPRSSAFFGNAVALDGDRFVVGSRYHDVTASGELDGAGAAYVYEIGDAGVGPAIPLAPDTAQAGANFGGQVAIAGTRVAVAAPQDDLFASDAGAVYVFEIEDGSPRRIDVLGMGPAGGQGGNALAVNTLFVAVGFPFHEEGFVTLFEGADAGFTGLPRLAPDALPAGARFGRAAGTSERFLIVGAPDASGGSTPGAVYLFELRR